MIREITDNMEKQNIAREILNDLPEWFGIEEALNDYVDSVVKYPFLVIEEDEVIGFYSLREENPETLDMYVLGIKKKYHGKGYGTKLQNFIDAWAKEKGYQRLIVLTLSNKSSDKNYAMTRDFYHKVGFVDMYESDKIWDEHNPTLIMMKVL